MTPEFPLAPRRSAEAVISAALVSVTFSARRSSVLAAFALAVFGGVLLWQTGSNPAGLSVGICLLGSHADLLRDARKYAIITKNEIG